MSNLKGLQPNVKYEIGLDIQPPNVGTSMIILITLMKIYLKHLSPPLCQIRSTMIQTGILTLELHPI